MVMVEKRDRNFSSPTGRTPTRHLKRIALREVPVQHSLHEPRKLTLDQCETSTQPEPPAVLSEKRHSPSFWSDDETKALLEFLLLHRPSDRWPSTKDKGFWDGAAEFVKLRGKGRIKRSGE